MSKKETITIKKYANRRLYNTASSSYVTLEDLCLMVKDGIDFAVYDAKSGEDITRSVLTQIIVEEENKGQSLLPINFLRQLISFYRGQENWLLPRYLDYSMDQFQKNQNQFQDFFQKSFGNVFPFSQMGQMPGSNPFAGQFSGAMEQMSKQNMALFEQAMKMFMPYAATSSTPDSETLKAVQEKLAELQKNTTGEK